MNQTINYIRYIKSINEEECNKEFTMEKAIEIILYKLIMEKQRDKVNIDDKNKIITVDLDERNICNVKYEEIEDNMIIIPEYNQNKIKLIKAELERKI